MQNISPWFVLVLGMATVFIGLICLILLTKIMSAVMVKNKGAAPAAQEKATMPAAQAAAVPAALNIGDRKLLDAILAASMGTEPQGLRIHSIRCLSAAPVGDRGQFVAAVSAAVATAMGTEPQGLRIHSIKRV